MLPKENSLVTAVDRVLALYAPVLGKWLNDNKDFHGISAIIDREDAAAWPSGETGTGFTDIEFERMAAPIMRSMEEDLKAIKEACPVIRSMERPLSVSAMLNNEGDVVINAAASTGYGEAFIRRSAKMIPTPSPRFVCGSASFVCFFHSETGSDFGEIEKSVQDDFRSAIGRLAQQGRILNHTYGRDVDLLDWVDAIDLGSYVKANRFGDEILSVTAFSQQDPAKILVSHEEYGALKNLVPVGSKVIIETFEAFDGVRSMETPSTPSL